MSVLHIIQETDDWLAVDKPALLSVHNNPGNDLVSLLKKGLKSTVFIAPVNRLDVGTSGIVLFAKSSKATALLGTRLANGEFKKSYLALSLGRFGEDKKLASPLQWALSRRAEGRKNPMGPKALRVAAITHYKIDKLYDGCSLLAITLETGRKHQIRRHLAIAGHPILGDDRYAKWPKERKCERLALHAVGLRFRLFENDSEIALEALPGDDFWQMADE